jgi:hypothetical protein
MLFSDDAEVNRSKIYNYLDLFCRAGAFGRGEIKVSKQRMDALSLALSANMQVKERMSPFKIAGIFSIEFVLHQPVITKFPRAPFSQLEPNSVFAFFYSVDGLVNATIAPQGITRRIPNRIKVSEHFLKEFTGVLSKCEKSVDAQLCALIYETLCFQFNELYYERKF